MLALPLGVSCQAGSATQSTGFKLAARPRRGVTTTAKGEQALGLRSPRDAWLYVPERAAAGAVPLAVLLHGAGSGVQRIRMQIGQAAEAAGLAVLIPESRGSTWDAIYGGFGPDVAFIDRALTRVFELVNVDPARIALGGFSDGASYALSLGIPNGTLFTRIIAFSPGFMVGAVPDGKPKVFVSHGTADTVLPIDRCSRVLVPELRQRGYDVSYREFDGGHLVPPEIAKEGFALV